MGLRGPAKKPSALELAQGNPGKRPANSSEPKFAEGVPVMPRFLNAAARKIWREQIDVMLSVPGLLTVGYSRSLAAFCVASADLEAAIGARDAEARRVIAANKKKPAEDRRPAGEIRDAVFFRYEARINRLLHRQTAQGREIGWSGSACSSMRMTGAPKSKGNPLDGAMFGGQRRLVAV